MPLPGYLSTATLTFGPYYDLAGNPAYVGMQGKLTLSQPMVDSIGGGTINPSITVTIGSDGTASAGPVVANDDPAVTQGTVYVMRWQALSYKPTPGDKVFQLLRSEGTTIDYDTIATVTGSPGAVSLPTVVSVNGKTGVVSVHEVPAGGSSGQVLAKTSNTDYAVGWQAGSAGALIAANNLSDLASPTAARTNLGLGGAATLSVGTTAGTVAAGDDARFGTGVAQSLYGVKTQPWKPSPAIGPELWALANFVSGTGANSTTLTPSITASGSLVTLDTRVNLGNLIHRDTAFRLSLNVTGTPSTGWFKVSALLSDATGAALSGTQEQFLTGDQEGYGLTGVRAFEFLPNASGVTGTVYLTVRLQVWNNVTSGQAISIGNVSLREIAHVARPIQYGAISSYASQAVMVPLYDPVAGTWRYAINSFQPDGALTVAFNACDGTYSDQPFNGDVVCDPTFAVTWGKRGVAAPTIASTALRSLRINNNDQILVVRRSDGTTFDFRGNTHGGEVNSPAATFFADLNDGNGWQAWDGTGTRLRPAVRFQLHYPTTISRPAPDSDQFATVDHLATFFGNGVIRMDRTTTFTQNTVVNQVIEWMSSHSTAAPKIGRMGRGLVVIDEVDVFPKVATPATPTSATATTGGTLATGTYTYAVTALTEGGETTPSATVAQVTTGATSTVTVSFTTVSGATGYRVYGRTAGRLAHLVTLGPAATSWIDDGSLAALPLQPPAVNTARQLGATTFVQDAATSSNGYWSVWYDPIVDMCYANIYDRDAVLARTGVVAAKSRLEGGSGIVKSYLNPYFGSATYTIPNGTVWSATHWAYTYIPQDKKQYHLETALLASDLAALKTNYPAT